MIRTFQHYWYDIRKTLIFYSLLPAFLFLLIAYPLLYGSFLYTLYDSNAGYNKKISKMLEKELSDYEENAYEFAGSEEIKQLILQVDNLEMVDIYEKVYAFLGEHEIRANCFVADTEGNILLATSKFIPEFLEKEYISYNGIIARMKNNPQQVILERYITMQQRIPSMCIGRAIELDGEVKGYVLFELSREQLLEPLQKNSSVVTAIADRFGYVFAGTVNNSLIYYEKLAKPLRTGEGKVVMDGRSLYVVHQPLLEDKVLVYTITDVGYTDTMFVRIGVLLLILAVMITVLLLFTSQRFAKRKSKVLDDMVSAIQYIQKGDLTTRLEVTSNDEFRLFATEYNRMLAELEKAMQKNEEMTRHTVISEIKQLESQFNPHFLYNTLNSIKYMVDLDPDGAREMITNMSEILRYSIKITDSQTLLEQDLEYTKSYLTILQYRFRDMLKFSLHISPETLDCLVPKLIIQPVIENAVKYGFLSSASLTIDISAELQNLEVVLVIKNDGVGMEPERLEEVRRQLESEHYTQKNHIGLYNIHRRIQLLYGRNYGVTVESTPETGTTVTIRLPVERGRRND